MPTLFICCQINPFLKKVFLSANSHRVSEAALSMEQEVHLPSLARASDISSKTVHAVCKQKRKQSEEMGQKKLSKFGKNISISTCTEP